MSQFDSLKVPELTKYLKERGVQTSGKPKRDLIALCEACDRISLPKNPDLEGVNKELYTTKLEQHGVVDPLENVEKFQEVKDIGELPVIGLYDIFNYLLDSRADYDKKKLKAYKSAEDYRLFADGHVEQVKTFSNGDSPIMSVLAEVKPTQRDITYLNKKCYMLWILLKKEDASVILAYCQCKGGSDGACRHVAATLYDLESYGERIRGCTDVPMPWVKRARQSDEATEVKNLNIATARYNHRTFPRPTTSSSQLQFTDVRHPHDRNPPTENDLKDFCEGLRKIDSNVCCLSALQDPSQDQPEGGSPAKLALSARAKELSVRARMSSFFNQLNPGQYEADRLCRRFVDEFRYTTTECTDIESITRAQSACPDWHVLRQNRMTASEMKRIHTKLLSLEKDTRGETEQPTQLLKALTSSTDLSHVAAIQWGVKQEGKARKRYAIVERRRHKALCVSESGLHVSEFHPLFACSPDGIVVCKCKHSHGLRGQKWLIEIKCPLRGKNMLPNDAAMKFCGVQYSNNVYSVNPCHKYYMQIQTQLGITGLQVCDLVVFTKKGLHVTEVQYDAEMFETIKQTIVRFGEKYLFPYLVMHVQD